MVFDSEPSGKVRLWKMLFVTLTLEPVTFKVSSVLCGPSNE